MATFKDLQVGEMFTIDHGFKDLMKRAYTKIHPPACGSNAISTDLRRGTLVFVEDGTRVKRFIEKAE